MERPGHKGQNVRGQNVRGQGAKARVADRLRSATGVEELEARVAELEAEVRRHEATHIRFAELVDLVQELLIPIAERDQAKVAEAVERFTAELDQTS